MPDRLPGILEPGTRVHLYQSLVDDDRFAWLVEKASEIGVSRIVPMVAAQTQVEPPPPARSERWRRIAIAAAERYGRRSGVTVVGPSQPFAEALAGAPGVVLMPRESTEDGALDVAGALDAEIDAVFALGEVSIFVGPEGGFAPDEIAAAQEAGAAIVTLGRRVLRPETAGLVAVTLALQATGGLG